ncbi:hypothetical protein KO493_01190 [Tamlana agarivorans]|uniref:Uncharacterized protein n=1 Tax=Pseudotamlana agarivorans TaxID=481183 RepID=A0ACC5U4R8_9FLAO|nr:hypothetical protein [Tamlana agarivorans]MBU2949311.1 hypothetical protein [Tamlana agarivorans]
MLEPLNTFQIVGWIGSASYLISYFLLSINRLQSNSIIYQSMNVIGGLCLVICAYDTKDNPNLFTNFVWMCIGLVMIVSIFRKKNSKE